MFYYSIKSHRKIMHTEKCYILSRLDPESVGSFDSLKKAEKAGYKLCKHCNPLRKQLKKEKTALMEYCRTSGMSYTYCGNYIEIKSFISKWRIGISNCGDIVLYHKNDGREKAGGKSIFSGYHNQKVSFSTLIDYFDYICEHEYYRNSHPLCTKKKKAPPKKGTRRWNNQQRMQARRSHRKAVSNVLNLIDSLDTNYNCDLKIY